MQPDIPDFPARSAVKMKCDKCGGTEGVASSQGVTLCSMPPQYPFWWVCDKCRNRQEFLIIPRPKGQWFRTR